MDEFNKLKCKKEYGVWYYKKIKPTGSNDLDAPIYELYNSKKEFVNTFGCYSDMKYFVIEGVIL